MKRIENANSENTSVNELLFDSSDNSYWMVTAVWENGSLELAKVDLDNTKKLWP